MIETTEAVVRRVLAETFGVDPASIGHATVAEDVDGWDSLQHTILMVRLARALGVNVPEQVAEARTVGELIEGLDRLRR